MSDRDRRGLRAGALILGSTILIWVGCTHGNRSTSPVPKFLEATAWPSELEVPFQSYTPSETSTQWVESGPNVLRYSFPTPAAGEPGNGKLHSSFQNCVGFPCVPNEFLAGTNGQPLPCDFYMFRDSSQGGKYMAYAYSAPLQKYAVIAEGLGPMHPDFLSRYWQVNSILPVREAPARAGLPVTQPKSGKVLWFRAAGFGGTPETEDLFAPYDTPEMFDGVAYRAPFTFGGKHGQAVYGAWDLTPNFTTATFQPPSGYTEVAPGYVEYQEPRGTTIRIRCPMKQPFDVYDHPVSFHNANLEPLRGTVMVCVACHDADLVETP